jgi:hypothetical protein
MSSRDSPGYITVSKLGAKDSRPQCLGRVLGHAVVFFPILVFRPGIEPKLHDRDFGQARVPPHKHRAEVARPTSIGWDAEELDSRQVYSHP